MKLKEVVKINTHDDEVMKNNDFGLRLFELKIHDPSGARKSLHAIGVLYEKIKSDDESYDVSNCEISIVDFNQILYTTDEKTTNMPEEDIDRISKICALKIKSVMEIPCDVEILK